MNSTRKTSLLSITISAVLLSGLIAPSLPQAFAGATCLPFTNDVTAQDDLCAPPFGINAPNSVFRAWSDQGILTDQSPTCDETTGNLVPDQGTPWSADESNFKLFGTEANFSPINNGFSFFIPNLIDTLQFKDMHIQLSFCEKTSSQGGDLSLGQSIIQNVFGVDDVAGGGFNNDCSFVQSGSTLPDTTDAVYFFEDWFCEPNPDWENFDVIFNTNDWILVQVVVDTWSFGEAVGGIFEGVNTAALLVAGAQANALWLIPLITAIGIGIVIIKRKF